MTSYQSHSANASPLSPSIPAAPSTADQDFSLPASSETIQSSLKLINDYVKKHYDQLIEYKSLEHNRLVASFAEKEQNYEKQILILRAISTDIAGLLAQEQSANSDLHQRLAITTNSITGLLKVVADANFLLVDRNQVPHGIAQEVSPQESANVSSIVMCPNPAISSLLSQIETIVIEIDAQNASPADSSPRRSIIETLDKDSKSADAARVRTEGLNKSLQEKIALLQEELKRTKGVNQRISQELAAVRLERENHICQPPASLYPTPVTQDDFPISLPSPPLEKRDLPIPDDILQDTCKISRKTNQTPEKRVTPGSATTPPLTPTVKARPSSASTSTDGERRRISINETVKLGEAKSTSSTERDAFLESPIARDEHRTTGVSMPPPSTPVQGVKRASSGFFDCQDIPRASSSTLASATSLTSDKTSNHRPRKKRRINGASGTSLKNKPVNETHAINANSTHASTPITGLPSASLTNRNVVQLPKTRASDLKSLKFNKVTQSPPTPTSTKFSNTSAPSKSNRTSMKPLDLARKSPQERAALHKAK